MTEEGLIRAALLRWHHSPLPEKPPTTGTSSPLINYAFGSCGATNKRSQISSKGHISCVEINDSRLELGKLAYGFAIDAFQCSASSSLGKTLLQATARGSKAGFMRRTCTEIFAAALTLAHEEKRLHCAQPPLSILDSEPQAFLYNMM